MPRLSGGTVTRAAALMLAALPLAACAPGVQAPQVQAPGDQAPDAGPAASDPPPAETTDPDRGVTAQGGADDSSSRSAGRGAVTLAFAGDVHFEGALDGLPQRSGATLGPMSRHLRSADLAMVNLESALAGGGRPTGKELEDPDDRYWFRTPPEALGLFDRSGVDVVSLANNHGADYGAAGLQQSLKAAEDAPVAVVGVGGNATEAFTPHRVTVKGTDVSVFAAATMFRESGDPIWAAGEGGPGIASARERRPQRLLSAVRRADGRGDLVVVYLHWGRSLQECPTAQQRRLARQLSSAGADVVVGSGAHVLLGAGMRGDTYVAYGLADFAWYHGARPATGVLKLRVVDRRVVKESFVPGRIPGGGGLPRGLAPDARAQARAQWEALRGCTGLRPVGDTMSRNQGDREPPEQEGALPAYESTVREIGPALRRRMSSSHDPDRCPVALRDLRHLTMSYVGFDGRARTGEMVVAAEHARDVVGVFEKLYDARWPIRRMELVDEYGGNDNRSMAANNTSAYNCRPVAGQDTWSAHAYGAAIDINPVQNPYLTDDGVLPPDGRRFADVDRTAGADAERGVITRGDVVMRAFEGIGWSWGGDWAQPDYQHFTAR